MIIQIASGFYYLDVFIVDRCKALYELGMLGLGSKYLLGLIAVN